ncbi:MAG: DUF1727 domain-containing protein, partial [Tyzzerella sp.]|nr:DUF1727 domain-containing protein [Tyzzerella sp.]
YTVTDVQYEDEFYSFDMDGMRINSTIRSPYNIYNTLAAYTAVNAMDAKKEHFQSMIESFDYGNNREDIFCIDGARVQLHLAKNPIGFQQKISSVLKDEKDKDVVILINDTYQDGEDVSWLWDVDFQYLDHESVKSITTTGTRRYDMGLRLKYEDIPCNSTTNLKSLVEDLVKNGTRNLYVIVNYTGLFSTNHMLSDMAKASADAKQDAVKGGE